MFAIGERFDRYRIEALLGQGGMGAVYRAFDTKLERRVALKILRTSAEPSEHDSAGHAARLLREARAAAALDHPNVISIFDVGEVDGTTFLAMEFIEGRSLRTFVASDTPIATRLAWLVDIARALALAHRRGLVHRDIKPENVMLRDDGVIKVLDFGIARRTHAIADSTGTLTNQSTTLGTGNESKLVGTPHYMAPEQMRGGQIDGRTDQFAWGVLAYELLSRGALPWPNAHDLVALVAAVMSEDPQPMPNVAALDPAVVGVVMRTLRRAPQERFASMEDVVAALGEEPAPSVRSGLAARNASLRNTPGASAAALADTLGADGAMPLGQAPAGSSTDKRTSTTGALAETIAADKLGPDKPAAPTRRRRMRALIAAGVVVALALVGVGAYAVHTKSHGGLDGSSTTAATNIPGARRAIAVLGFRSLSGREDVAWIGTALTETMTGELAMGEQLRTSSVDDVERMKRDLSLRDADKLDKDALARIGKHLGTELVVSGTYLAVGGKVRLDVRLVDVKTGEVLATVNESDTENALIDLVARAGSSVRRHLRAGDLSQEQEKDLRALQPATPEAARTYAEGLAKLRTFDGVGAQKAFERVVTLEPGFAPGHAALTDARLMLGLGDAAIESAKRAMELSQSLRREERMVYEVRYYEATSAWAKAIEVAQTLHELFPDNLEHGLRLAKAQTEGAKGKDALATLERLRRLPPPIGEDPRIDLAEAEASSALGDLAPSSTAARRALTKADAMGATTIAVRAQMSLGFNLVSTGENAKGIELLEDARRRAATTGDRILYVEVLNNVAVADSYRGNLAAAHERFAEVARVCRELGSTTRAAEVMANVATLAIEMGNFDEAERALAGTTQALSPMFRAMVRLLGARVAALRGDVSKARSEYIAAIRMLRDAQDERMLAWGQALFAELALDEGKLDEAETLAKESLATRSRLDLTLFTGESRLLIARILLAKGVFADAEKEAKAALDTFVAERSVALEAAARAVIAQIQLATKRSDDAEKTLAQARSIAEKTQLVATRLEVMTTGAVIDARQGKTEDAHKALDSVIAEAQKLGIPRFELEGRIAKARIDMGANKTAQGRAALAAAAKDAEKLGLHGITRKAQP